MNEDVRRPRGDDRPLWDIIMGIYGHQAVLLCHDLKLFPLLAGKPGTLEEIAAALQIAPRPAQALVQVCTALGLVKVQEGVFSLTPVAEDYLLESGPAYFGGFLDYTLAHRTVLSFDSLKKAVLTNNAPSVLPLRPRRRSPVAVSTPASNRRKTPTSACSPRRSTTWRQRSRIGSNATLVSRPMSATSCDRR
jgi:hypothetical protein